MIVFCPEAFINQISGKGVNELERGFIKFFVAEVKKKMIIANETWETFRLRIINDSPNKEEARDLVASFRGVFEPEEILLKNHQEIPPKQEYSKTTMIEKTKSLVERNYGDIEIIITTNETLYQGCSKGIPCMNVEEFYLYCMLIPKYRVILEKYWRLIEYKKAIGEG